jgi:hypothetical protein
MNTEIYFDKSEEKLIICDKTSAETECEMICHFHKKNPQLWSIFNCESFLDEEDHTKKVKFFCCAE